MQKVTHTCPLHRQVQLCVLLVMLLCNTVERYSCLACVCDVGTKVLCADKSFINSNVRP